MYHPFFIIWNFVFFEYHICDIKISLSVYRKSRFTFLTLYCVLLRPVWVGFATLYAGCRSRARKQYAPKETVQYIIISGSSNIHFRTKHHHSPLLWLFLFILKRVVVEVTKQWIYTRESHFAFNMLVEITTTHISVP